MHVNCEMMGGIADGMIAKIDPATLFYIVPVMTREGLKRAVYQLRHNDRTKADFVRTESLGEKQPANPFI